MANTKINTYQMNDYNFNNSMARQAIINGNFDVWQRGTSFTNPISVYTADRWFKYQANNVNCVISRQDGTSVTGSQYCLKYQRTAGQGADGCYLGQPLETNDSIKFRGKKLTLSFWAKCGANYSATSSYLSANIMTGTGTDQSISSLSADVTLNAVLTTSWQKFTLTTTNAVASNITQIGLLFIASLTGSAGADDSFYIAQVQLCAGDVALPFMPKSFEEELRACMRYAINLTQNYQYSIIASGYALNTTSAYCMCRLPVQMRKIPTLSALNASNFSLGYGTTGNIQLTGLALAGTTSDACNLLNVTFNCAVAGGLTANSGQMLYANSGVPLILDAEL